MPETVTIKTRNRTSSYPITIGRGGLLSVGETARTAAASGRKAVIVSNSRVFALYGDIVSGILKKAGFEVKVAVIGDGERFKSLRTLEKTLRYFGENGLSRTDLVVALGGGVVGDLAGFAASVYLRGIPFVQVPTTLLSMIDSSVGGKTGINTEFGKNLVGAFYQPAAVVIDPDVLSTLPKRELTAGFCEAVKQGALGGKRLLDMTSKAIDDGWNGPDLEAFLAEQVKFKAAIVAADERESVERSDAKSRKILNFGHTFGHAIEKVTNYRRFKHGEAVGHGIVFASELSKKLELIGPDEVKLLNDVVHRAGTLPSLRGIDPLAVFETFSSDKKNIGDSLQWILLKGIGKPVIVRGDEIPTKLLKENLRTFIQN